jgi:hypothetical protein
MEMGECMIKSQSHLIFSFVSLKLPPCCKNMKSLSINLTPYNTGTQMIGKLYNTDRQALNSCLDHDIQITRTQLDQPAIRPGFY